MVDIEFVAELLVGIMHGPQNKKTTLDSIFQTYEEKLPDKPKWIARFEDARAMLNQILPDLRDTRWRGKSDFYSLFLAVDTLLQRGRPKSSGSRRAGAAIRAFGEAVTKRLSKEGSSHRASVEVRRYASAVEKAASDKDRRETRHRVLTRILSAYFR